VVKRSLIGQDLPVLWKLQCQAGQDETTHPNSKPKWP